MANRLSDISLTTNSTNTLQARFTSHSGAPSLSDFVDAYETHDEHKIPASIEEAELHRQCTSIGTPVTTGPPDQLFCPPSYSIKKNPVSFFQNYSVFTGMGTTIPVYYHFKRWMVCFYLVMLVYSAYPIYTMARMRTDYDATKAGKPAPSSFSAKFLKAMTTNFVIFSDGKIESATNSIDLNDHVLNWVLFFFSMLFSLNQQWFWKKVEDKREVCARDFTVMVGNVKAGDEEQDVKRYIDGLMEKAGLARPRIVKMNKACFECSIREREEQVETIKLKIHRIEELIHEKREDFDCKQKEAGRKRILELEKDLEKAKKVLSKAEDKLKYKRDENDNSSVVFVTFATLLEKRAVMQAKPNYGMYLTRLSKPQTGLKLMEAPFPGEVEWENIGYSNKQRLKNMFKAQLSILIVVPVFVLAAYGLTYLELLFINLELDTYQEKVIMLTLTALLLIFTFIGEHVMDHAHEHFTFISCWKEQVLKTLNLLIIEVADLVMSVVVESQIKFHDEETKLVAIGSSTFSFLIIFVIIVPIVHHLHPTRLCKKSRRNKIRDKLLSAKEFTCPEHFMTQQEMNEVFEKEAFPIGAYYNNLVHCAFILIISYFLCRISMVLGLINLIVTDLIERYDNKNRYRAPPPSAKFLSQGMRYHTCFQLMRVFTYVRLIRYYRQWRDHGQLSIFFWLDLIFLMFNFSRFVLVLENKFIFSRKEVITKARMTEHQAATATEEEKARAKLKSYYEFQAESGKELRKSHVERRRFEEVECHFLTDYDRENPLTAKKARDAWMGRVKEMLKRTSPASKGAKA